MAQIRKPKHPDVYTLKPGSLLQRGNFTMLRMLSVIASTGANGITTRALHEQLGTHSDRMNAIIRKAHELGYIDRIRGEPPGPGQFRPVYNRITEKGKRAMKL
jgi:DNA-binding MarR family transcriptional regulator